MRKLKATVVTAVVLGTGSVHAADAMLTFTGSIIFPTCTVDPNSVSKTVNLDAARTTDFLAVGNTQKPQAFNLTLINCVTGSTVTMTLSGTATSVPSVLANTGTAAQVGVQLLKAVNSGDTTGTVIALGAGLVVGTAGATNALTIPLVAQYYRLGTMTAGTVNTSATVNFTYN